MTGTNAAGVEISRTQALLYAKELGEALRRERDRSRELEMRIAELAQARLQLAEYARSAAAALASARARQNEVSHSQFDAIRVLAAAVEARDPYTGGHIERVMHYALHVARELGWSDARLVEVQMGAALHDIGKIGVDDAVLRKVGPLDAEDRVQIRAHPELGARILDGVGFFEPAIPYVLHHQERFDGTGYPYGLAGEAIPIEGRLVAVADAFDALTTARPYRAACLPADALAVIQRDAGRCFDPQVVAAFARAWPRIVGAMPAPGAPAS